MNPITLPQQLTCVSEFEEVLRLSEAKGHGGSAIWLDTLSHFHLVLGRIFADLCSTITYFSITESCNRSFTLHLLNHFIMASTQPNKRIFLLLLFCTLHPMFQAIYDRAYSWLSWYICICFTWLEPLWAKQVSSSNSNENLVDDEFHLVIICSHIR